MLAGTRRCLAGRLGHLRPVDPHHLLPERRYALDEAPPGHAGCPPEIPEVAATGCCGRGRPIEITGRRGDGAPAGFRWHGRVERVRQVQAAWQLAEGWWRGTQPPHGATRRQYYRVVTAAGLRCDLYHDQVAAGWYLARVLD